MTRVKKPKTSPSKNKAPLNTTLHSGSPMTRTITIDNKTATLTGKIEGSDLCSHAIADINCLQMAFKLAFLNSAEVINSFKMARNIEPKPETNTDSGGSQAFIQLVKKHFDDNALMTIAAKYAQGIFFPTSVTSPCNFISLYKNNVRLEVQTTDIPLDTCQQIKNEAESFFMQSVKKAEGNALAIILGVIAGILALTALAYVANKFKKNPVCKPVNEFFSCLGETCSALNKLCGSNKSNNTSDYTPV